MASSINASTSGAGGVITTADNTGILQLQTAATTAVTVDASQNVGIGTSSPLAKLNVSKADSSLNSLFSGTTKGLRIGTNSTYSYIEGVDTTGSASYQPFMIGGSDVRFTTSDTERMRIDSSGNLLFNSGYGSVATAYGCRAWVNFNGTGTVAIRASGNVSSITDNGTGDYTVNFTTAMPDANYSVGGSIRNSTDGSTANRDNTTHGLHVKGNTSPTTGAVAIKTTMGATDVSTGAYIDYWQVNVNINR